MTGRATTVDRAEISRISRPPGNRSAPRNKIGNCPRRLAIRPRGTIVARATPMDYIDIFFDGPPSPEGARFVEVEDSRGRSINFGEWVRRPDGYWPLAIPAETRQSGR